MVAHKSRYIVCDGAGKVVKFEQYRPAYRYAVKHRMMLYVWRDSRWVYLVTT